MSITRLQKLRLIGPSLTKTEVLDELQTIGCLMLVPLKAPGDGASPSAPRREVHEALAFLLSCPRRRSQVFGETGFDADAVQQQALKLHRTLQDLEDERDRITQRLRDLAPFGGFTFPDKEELGGQMLWFYPVPLRLAPQFEAAHKQWSLVNKDDANGYYIVISADDPGDVPVPRAHTGNLSPAQLRQRLGEVTQLIEDAQEERYSLTRWCELFIQHLHRLEDRATCEEASRQTLDIDPLFGLEAWVPAANLDEVRACAQKHGLALEATDPTPQDEPPTLMKNRPGIDAGEGLVSFYMTPGYRTWDPSPVVLFSFAIFFAMILADGGYALLLGLLLLFIWKRSGATPGGRKMRTLLALLTGASLTYGVIVGSYFGVAPSEDSLLGRLAFLNVNDTSTMMALSVIIGVAHLVMANLLNARRFGWRQEALAPLGWSMAILGGFLVPVAGKVEVPVLKTLGLALLIGGGLAILLFSGVGQKPLPRMVSGLLAFTKVTSAFGDVLSYLRLFALGLAGASLAVAFNNMADGLRNSMPGIGLLLALLVLLIGHALNLILSLSSAVIHGLRLNVIEFFNWGLPEEGKPFTAFAKKEH